MEEIGEGIMEDEMLAGADTWNPRRGTAAAQSCDLDLLPLFPPASDLPKDPDEIVRVLGSPVVQEVRCFVLGPEGTNIAQACARWLERVGLQGKSTLTFCDTPEDSVDAARRETDPELGILGIFWTCAVFDREKEIFFKNPDAYPFFVQETMLLDEMQLATRPELASGHGRSIPAHWRIASHPSPVPLVDLLPCTVIPAHSNAAAAASCANGECEACITTESARRIYNLTRLHRFGSPPMVFFGGITERGASLFRRAR